MPTKRIRVSALCALLVSACGAPGIIKKTLEVQPEGGWSLTVVYRGLVAHQARELLTAECAAEAERLGCYAADVTSTKEEIAPPKDGAPEGTPPSEKTTVTGTLQCRRSTP